MVIVYQIILLLVRVATNMIAVPLWAGIAVVCWKMFSGDNIFDAFGSSFSEVFLWSFSSIGGLVIAIIFGIMGLIHGIKMWMAKTHLSVGAFFGFLADNTWGLPNTVVGSIFATFTVAMEIDETASEGSSKLVMKNGLFGNTSYDTTFGNVTTGTIVPTHEFVHVMQARILGPLFYPIYIANFAVNLIPYWWLIKLIFNMYSSSPIENVGHYFTRGVYPFTIFEMIAYAFEGSPP
jgi:hypothetical protein